eukprot:COSAG01_NODE_8398_length_2800_cov_1.720474_2_plen_87_part_00
MGKSALFAREGCLGGRAVREGGLFAREGCLRGRAVWEGRLFAREGCLRARTRSTVRGILGIPVLCTIPYPASYAQYRSLKAIYIIL